MTLMMEFVLQREENIDGKKKKILHTSIFFFHVMFLTLSQKIPGFYGPVVEAF